MPTSDPLLGAVSVAGGRCRTCGFVFAPMQAFGCERCGAYGDQLEPLSLSAAGRLCSSATVHVHRKPIPATPFTVVEVALDAGPTVRTLAGDGLSGPLRAGMRMVGLPGETQDALLRFAPATEASAASEPSA